MLAVVKKPHTNTMLFEIKGNIPNQVLGYLQQEFGQGVEIVEDDDEEWRCCRNQKLYLLIN